VTGEPSEEWLDWFAIVTRAEVLQIWRPDSCIESTRVGLAVLERYGYSARPVVTGVVAANAAAIPLARRGVPVPEWPKGAWTVGVTAEGNHLPDRFDGHLVLVLRRAGGRRLLIDLSADQMDRPERDLRIRGPIIGALPSIWTPEDPLTLTSVDGVKVSYWPVLGLTTYRDSVSWQGRKEEVEETVARIVARLEDSEVRP